jgi:hypothetical protein
MILDGILVGVLLAGLELAVAWLLAVITNQEDSEEKNENQNNLKNAREFSTIIENGNNNDRR